MTGKRKLLGILGGSFDPVHFGHIKPTLEIVSLLGLSRLLLMPCKISPLKKTTLASSRHRVNMLHLIADNVPEFSVDERELHRPSPSYSVDTVQEVQAEYPDCSICWIMGLDSFYSLPAWHRVSDFLQSCHVIVTLRNGVAQNDRDQMMNRLNVLPCNDLNQLTNQRGGTVLFLETNAIDISSTQIRDRIANGQSIKYMVPGAVWNYIQRNHLYGLEGETV